MTEISRRPGLGGPGNAEQRWRVITAPHDIGTSRPVPGPRGLAAQAVKPPKSASLRRVTAEDGSLPKFDQGLGRVVTVSKLPVTTRRTSRLGGQHSAFFSSPPAPSTWTVPGGDAWHSGEAVPIFMGQVTTATADNNGVSPVVSPAMGKGKGPLRESSQSANGGLGVKGLGETATETVRNGGAIRVAVSG